MPDGYGWSPEVQRKVVALALQDPEAWRQLGAEILDATFVGYQPLRPIAQAVFAACAENDGPPSPEMAEELIRERVTLLRPSLADVTLREWELVKTTDLSDAALVRGKATDWARTQALVKASNRVVDLLEGGVLGAEDGDGIVRMFQDALAVGKRSEAFLRMIGNPQGVWEALQRTVHRTKTGFAALDAVTRGGVEVGLNVIAGAAKRGKTTFLTQVDVAEARAGVTVWHVSGEVQVWAMACRTLSALTGLRRDEVLRDLRHATNLTAGYDFAGGQILVEYAPRFTPDWMATRVRQLEAQGYRIGAITADYIDLMSTSSRDKMHERRWELSAIAKDLRSLAVEIGVPIWTAKAVTANSVDKPVLTMQDIGECKEIAYIVDNLFALCSTKEDRARVPKAVRLFYMLGRETEDERMLAAYERDNDRQRWVEIPGYLENEARKQAEKPVAGAAG